MFRNISLFAVLYFIIFQQVLNSQTNWGVQFSDAIISRYQPNINNMTKKGWEYSNSIVLHGMENIYERTKNVAYLNYIKAYVDSYIGSDGTNVSSLMEQNLDVFHPGLLCLFLYKETGLEKYKTAASLVRNYINNYPRTASKGFWHKSSYPNQMWLDGIYMAEPFLVKYGFRFNDATYGNNEATFQTLLVNQHTFDPNKNLLYHGWDESKIATWANPTTGVSPEVWSRAMGWYAMALVDILKYLPDNHVMYDSMLHVLNRVATGIKNYQDASTGLWFQVVDKGAQAGNWTETSGSGMFVYALKTAVNYGWIDTSFLAVARNGWKGVKSKIGTYTDGKPSINDFAAAMGIKTTFNQYVATSLIVDCPSASGTQHPHGYCALLLASSAMEYSIPKQYRLQISAGTGGSVSATTTELYQNSGSTVTITAQPLQGFKFSHWSGDTASSNSTISVTMNTHKHLTANFTNTTSAIINKKDVSTKLVFTPSITKNYTYARWNSSGVSNSRIYIFNDKGVNILTFKGIKNSIGDNEFKLDLTNFIPGLYICKLFTENQTYTNKILKL